MVWIATCQAFVSPQSGKLTSQATPIAMKEERRTADPLVDGLNEVVEGRAPGTRACGGTLDLLAHAREPMPPTAAQSPPVEGPTPYTARA